MMLSSQNAVIVSSCSGVLALSNNCLLFCSHEKGDFVWQQYSTIVSHQHYQEQRTSGEEMSPLITLWSVFGFCYSGLFIIYKPLIDYIKSHNYIPLCGCVYI